MEVKGIEGKKKERLYGLEWVNNIICGWTITLIKL